MMTLRGASATSAQRTSGKGRVAWPAALLTIYCAAAAGCDPKPHEAPAQRAALSADYRSARVDTALNAAEVLVTTRGFAREGEEWRGFLIEQAPLTRPIMLRHGSCYVAVAAGSGAIRDLGLRVFDADGGEVATGPQPGATTAIHLCPPQSGTYYLVARAAVGNGLFAARWFTGPSGLDIRIDDLFRSAPEVPGPPASAP